MFSTKVAAASVVFLLAYVAWPFLSERSDLPEGAHVQLFSQSLLLPENAPGPEVAVSIHAWVYQLNTGSLNRRAFLSVAERLLGTVLSPTPDLRFDIFQERAGLFLADNLPGHRLEIELMCMESGESLGVYLLDQITGNNGHVNAEIMVPRDLLVACVEYSQQKRTTPSGPVPVEILGPQLSSSRLYLTLEQREPFVLVSDIDDTIKVSNVSNKELLLENTFYRSFHAVPGMATLYNRWSREHPLMVHYVSASPWHLFSDLERFMNAALFPGGQIHLRHFRVKDRSLLQFLTASKQFKFTTICRLMTDRPALPFVLVGDSTENDPEIYGKLARAFPDQVLHIFIRNADRDYTSSDPRFEAAFAQLPSSLWTLFDDEDIEHLQFPKALI